MADTEGAGSNAVWAVVVLVLVAVIIWMFAMGPLRPGGTDDGATDINVDVEMPAATPGNQ